LLYHKNKLGQISLLKGTHCENQDKSQPSRYVINHLCQLSLRSFRGR